MYDLTERRIFETQILSFIEESYSSILMGKLKKFESYCELCGRKINGLGEYSGEDFCYKCSETFDNYMDSICFTRKQKDPLIDLFEYENTYVKNNKFSKSKISSQFFDIENRLFL